MGQSDSPPTRQTGSQGDHIADVLRRMCRAKKPSDALGHVNKDDGGGKKSGSGRGNQRHSDAHKGGEKGGKASASVHR